MLRCKNCNEKLTRLNKDICPYCGCENPIEKSENTHDITQVIDKLDLKNDKDLIKPTKINYFLLMFLGPYSIDLFYNKKFKIGTVRLLINILFYLIVSLPIYFSNNSLVVLAFTLPIIVLHLFYLVIGLVSYFFFFKKNKGK